MGASKGKSKHSLEHWGITGISALFAMFAIYLAINERGNTQFMAIALAAIFGGLALMLLVELLSTKKFTNLVPVVCQRIQTVAGDEPAFRFISNPSLNTIIIVLGGIFLFAGIALLIWAVRVGPDGWRWSIYGGNPFTVGIVLLAGVGSCTAGILNQTQNRNGITLTPTGVFWAQPMEQGILIPWGRIEGVELIRTSRTSSDDGNQTAIGLRLTDIPLQEEVPTLRFARERFQINRSEQGCELIFVQEQLVSPIAEIKLSINYYRVEIEHRSQIGSEKEYDHISRWVDAQIAGDQKPTPEVLFEQR